MHKRDIGFDFGEEQVQDCIGSRTAFNFKLLKSLICTFVFQRSFFFLFKSFLRLPVPSSVTDVNKKKNFFRPLQAGCISFSFKHKH